MLYRHGPGITVPLLEVDIGFWNLPVSTNDLLCLVHYTPSAAIRHGDSGGRASTPASCPNVKSHFHVVTNDQVRFEESPELMSTVCDAITWQQRGVYVLNVHPRGTSRISTLEIEICTMVLSQDSGSTIRRSVLSSFRTKKLALSEQRAVLPCLHWGWVR